MWCTNKGYYKLRLRRAVEDYDVDNFAYFQAYYSAVYGKMSGDQKLIATCVERGEQMDDYMVSSLVDLGINPHGRIRGKSYLEYCVARGGQYDHFLARSLLINGVSRDGTVDGKPLVDACVARGGCNDAQILEILLTMGCRAEFKTGLLQTCLERANDNDANILRVLLTQSYFLGGDFELCLVAKLIERASDNDVKILATMIDLWYEFEIDYKRLAPIVRRGTTENHAKMMKMLRKSGLVPYDVKEQFEKGTDQVAPSAPYDDPSDPVE